MKDKDQKKVKRKDVKKMIFLNNSHELKYQNLTQNARMYEHDLERMSLFYIISGNDDLFRKKNYIYDFNENSIRPECLSSGKVDFSSSSKSLIHIGFNLYNGYMCENMNLLWLLASLDAANLILLMNAIHLRFNNKINFCFGTNSTFMRRVNG
jgi:hypothetical protein